MVQKSQTTTWYKTLVKRPPDIFPISTGEIRISEPLFSPMDPTVGFNMIQYHELSVWVEHLAGGFSPTPFEKMCKSVKLGIFSPSFAVNMKKIYIWNHHLYEIISTSGTFKHPNSSLKWLETPLGPTWVPCENRDAARYENNLERRPLQDRSTPAMPCRSQSSSVDNKNSGKCKHFCCQKRCWKDTETSIN